jgi:hypothetical protein
MRKLFFLWMPMLLLAVEVRTNVRDVHHEGVCEEIGAFSLHLIADDFSMAGPHTPLYVRFRINHAQGWCRTLVDQRPGSDDATRQPINLAIIPNGGGSLAPDLPPEAVQLVRLIQGEREGWLRINTASSFWFQEGGVYAPPGNSMGSAFVALGITGSASQYPQTNTASGGNERSNTHELVSTVLCASYEDTPNFGPGDVDTLDFIAFDQSTQGVEDADEVIPGFNAAVGFSNDHVVCRGSNYIVDYCLERVEGHAGNTLVDQFQFIDLHQRQIPLPKLQLRNCSDIEWDEGEALVLLQGQFRLQGEHVVMQAGLCDPLVAEWVLSEMTWTTDTSVWDILPLFFDDRVVGFEFRLKEGYVPLEGMLTLPSVWLQTDEEQPCDLTAISYFKVRSAQGTAGDLVTLGPDGLFWTTFENVLSESAQSYLPYSAYDRPEWSLITTLFNPHEQIIRVNVTLSNRQGLRLRRAVIDLPPRQASRFSVEETFGSLAKEVLASLDIEAQRPLAVLGTLMTEQGDGLDVYSAIPFGDKQLFAPHVPQQWPWQFSAYVLATKEDIAPQMTFFSSEVSDESITSLRFPGSTAVWHRDDLQGPDGPLQWFGVQASQSSAVGQMLFFREEEEGFELASLPMNLGLKTQWRWEHVAKSDRGWWNGLGLLNPSEKGMVVDMTITERGGSPVAHAPLSLEAMSNQVFLLEDLFPLLTEASPGKDWILEGSSQEPFVGFHLMGRLQGRQMTTVPAATRGGHVLAMGLVPVPEDHWLGLVLLQDEAKSIPVHATLLTDSGTQEQVVTLEGKSVILLSDWFEIRGVPEGLILESEVVLRGFALVGRDDHASLATVPFMVVTP